jgi:hypothetical protein
MNKIDISSPNRSSFSGPNGFPGTTSSAAPTPAASSAHLTGNSHNANVNGSVPPPTPRGSGLPNGNGNANVNVNVAKTSIPGPSATTSSANPSTPNTQSQTHTQAQSHSQSQSQTGQAQSQAQTQTQAAAPVVPPKLDLTFEIDKPRLIRKRKWAITQDVPEKGKDAGVSKVKMENGSDVKQEAKEDGGVDMDMDQVVMEQSATA